MILLLNIPGTPCQIVQDTITAALKPTKVLQAGAPVELIYHTDQELAQADLLVARMGYRLARRLGPDVATIVFLRDPVTRVAAHYEELSQPRPDAAGEDTLFRPRGHTLEQMLSNRYDPATVESLINLQTYALHSDFWFASRTALKGVSDEELLTQAKANLEQVTFVGIVERMEESLRRLCAHFGWPPPDTTAVSTAVTQPEVSPDLASLIREQNPLDVALYEDAIRLFEARDSA